MRKSSWILAILTVATGFSAADLGAQTSIIPFFDDFESYTNGTPLINGLNGWYGSSSNIIVQTNTVYTGTNAAMIPDDCTLSNRFQNIASTNVWLQMDLLPVMYEETNPPVVDTNKAVLLYLNTNGNFVVHNGPTANPSNSTSWVEAFRGGVGTNGTNWVSVQIRINYSNQTWGLYNITTSRHDLVTNNIGFVNRSCTNFLGFSVYNGLNASYMDTVTVTNPPLTNNYLFVTPLLVTNYVMRGHTTNITLNVANRGDSNMYWNASITDAWIQIVGLSNGTVAAGDFTNLVVMNSSVTLTAGTYTGRVRVAATSDDTYLDPESAVVTYVLRVMDLLNTSAQLTNAVMQGDWASNSFEVWNAGPGVMDYTVTANQPWLVLSRAGGSLTGQTAWATNTIGVIYTNTSVLAVGQYHGLITITSSNFGGATNMLAVTLDVRAVPMLSASPALITNTVMQGQNVPSQVVQLRNGSAYYGIGYQVATNGGGSWLSVQVTNNYLAPLMSNSLTVNYAVSTNASAGDMPSNYTGTIIVTATNPSGSAASGSPLSIPVIVQVDPKPRMVLSLTNLSQTVLQGRDAVSQSFDIWNASGFYTLEFTVSKGLTPWLVLTPMSGTSTGQHARIEVQYSTANLPAGITNALITVVGRAWDGTHSRDNARDATQQVAVVLSVTPFATLTTDARSAYAYTVRKGVTPPDTIFNIWNSGDPRGGMNFTVRVVSPSASWLSVKPASGTSMGNMVQVRAQADATGMKPGVVYSGTVQIDATDAGSGKPAYGSPIAFPIAIVVRNFRGFDFQGGLSGASDLLLYREANGTWDIRNLLSNYSKSLILGGLGYQAVPGDYTGDGITDLGVYRPASGSWYAQQVGDDGVGVIEMKQWAGPEYVGMPGDYDGDGKTDPGVYLEKTGLWMLLLSGSGYQQVSGIFGGPGYAALLSGDYDGDAIVDPVVYNRASGLWTVLFSTTHSIVSGIFGGNGFVPVPTDYDGDGITDPAIYETATGNWYILMSTSLTSQGYSLSTYQFGGMAASTTLVPAPGNYDGVGGADLALYDTTTRSWFIMTLDGVPLAWGYPMGTLGSLPVLP